MSDINPYQSPTFSAPLPSRGTVADPPFINVLRSALQVMFGQWATFVAVLLLICLPWELAVSYIDYFIATEEDQTWPAVMMLLGPLSAILLAEGIVIAATRDHLLGFQGGVVASFARGIVAYPRLLLWMIASGIVIGIGTVLCILPGVYLNIRWMYVSAAVIYQDPQSRSPLNASWELTQRHMLFSAAVFLGLCIPMVVLVIVPTVLTEVSPTLQHWLIATVIALFSDSVLLSVTCAFACAFHHLRQVEDAADQSFMA
jgi:hypothetical protein